MVQLTQTALEPGKSSTVTLITLDQNGAPTPVKFLVPPGKDAQLPDNLVTQDDMLGYLVGVLGTGSSDQEGVGMHWNGWADTPQFVYGALSNQKYSNLLGTNAAGLYLTNYGNVVPEMPAQNRMLIQSFTSTDAKDGDAITFPHAFKSDDVQLFLTSRTPSTTNDQWIPPLVGYSSLTRNGFYLTRLYSNNSPKDWAGDVSILAIGQLG